EAIITVSQAVRRARAGLKNPRRPIGSFIFLGPTGIGKTELARALAEYLFDSEDALIKLDMSEFMERHTTARLVGSPPGYVDDELKRMFRPEFLNRVDAVVVFKSLTTGQIREIVDLQLVRLSKHLAEQQITIEVTDAAKDLLAKEGYDRTYGARPLRRVITSRIEDQLSEHLLRGKIARGDVVQIDVEGEDGLKFTPVKHKH